MWLTSNSRILRRSPAKLNLSLAILGKRPDGYHEIETLMVKIGLCDLLSFDARTDDLLTLNVRRIGRGISASIPTDSTNLVIRAADLLRHHAGIRFGADIVLGKRIPAEAGLAGGSGNAAATLLGLNDLWQLRLPHNDLLSLGSQLGSDIPFFIESASAAIARGRGEYIEPIRTRGRLHFVVVKPPFGLSTAGVYRAFAEEDGFSQSQCVALAKAVENGSLPDIGRHLENALSAPAERLSPKMAFLRTLIRAECRFGAMMTGSGSACFGLCGSRREASFAALRLRAARVGEVYVTMSV